MSDAEDRKGEGDRESARKYNQATEDFVQSERGREAIENTEARDEGKTGAEKIGESRAKELDPAVSRDYSKAEK